MGNLYPFGVPHVLKLSFFADILPLLFSFLMIGVVLYLCYKLSRFAAGKMNALSQSQNIHIVERVALGQDKGLLIAEICGSYYLLAFTGQRIEILKELDGQTLTRSEPTGFTKPDFMKILNDTLKGRGEEKHHAAADEPARTDGEKSRKNKNQR